MLARAGDAVDWVRGLEAWVDRSPRSVRVLVREGLSIEPERVNCLARAEILWETNPAPGNWLAVDADPPEPERVLNTVVCLGNSRARDILTVLGRAYRWLAPEGRLLLVDYFMGDSPVASGEGFLVAENVLSLAARAGFRFEAARAVALPWRGPSVEDRQRAVTAQPQMLVLTREERPGRWRVTYQEPGRFGQVRELFEQVFGHPMSDALWYWKYGQGRGQGALVLRDDRVVAHYGGLTRQVLYRGRPERAGQVADVMVEPGDRGVLTRQGAFFRAAASVPETCSGYGNKHLIGYGFPNRRHFALAERLGLYVEVERIVELTWPRVATRSEKWMLEDLLRLNPGRAAREVSRVWQGMAADLRDAIVGVRDYHWLRHRYLEHPEHVYRVLAVRRRWRRAMLGIVVLRMHEGRMELMDLVGSAADLPDLVFAARQEADTEGCTDLFCWITSSYVKWLASAGATVTDPDVCIPTSIRTPGPDPAELRGRWWLMSGDTDFR